MSAAMNLDSLFQSTRMDGRPMEAIVRFAAVKRWHMVDATKTQSLAEHSANVALLAYYIARTTPGMYFGPAEVVATSALMHDLSEVFTGDIPTLTKQHIEGVKQLEEAVLPVEFKTEVEAAVHGLIKLCDLADGIRFICIYGIGRTAAWAANGLELQLATLVKRLENQWSDIVLSHVVINVMLYARP